MNQQILEQLLAADESEQLEFKASIDLDSKEGKAKFLKTILALANSATRLSFLLIGVENKTKRVAGMPEVTEEQLQKVISDNCQPSIFFQFSKVDYKGVPVGVIQLRHSDRKPHTLKKKLGYLDTSNNKQQELQENQVFIRRGSTIGESTVDEIIRMAQDRDVDTEHAARVEYDLEGIHREIQEIAYTFQRSKFSESEDPPSRFVEGTLIGIFTGAIVGWLWGMGWPQILVLSPIAGVMVSVVAASLKMVRFGIIRSLATGILIGTITGLLLIPFGNTILPSNLPPNYQLISAAICGSLLGTVIGFVVSIGLDRVEQ
jgi:hypothetical protein